MNLENEKLKREYLNKCLLNILKTAFVRIDDLKTEELAENRQAIVFEVLENLHIYFPNLVEDFKENQKDFPLSLREEKSL